MGKNKFFMNRTNLLQTGLVVGLIAVPNCTQFKKEFRQDDAINYQAAYIAFAVKCAVSGLFEFDDKPTAQQPPLSFRTQIYEMRR